MVRGKTAYTLNIMGRRTTWSDTTSYHDVLEFSGGTLLNYVDPAGANSEIVSTSANDTAAGTGARTVQVCYLDAAGAMQVSTFTLNGVTPVNVGTAMHAVQWMEVFTVGSNITSIGTLTLRDVATPTTIYEQITGGGAIGA